MAYRCLPHPLLQTRVESGQKAALLGKEKRFYLVTVLCTLYFSPAELTPPPFPIPKGLKDVWRLCAQVLNASPEPSLTPRILWSIMAVSGHHMGQAYGGVFQNLMGVIVGQLAAALERQGDTHDQLELQGLLRVFDKNRQGEWVVAPPPTANIPATAAQ